MNTNDVIDYLQELQSYKQAVLYACYDNHIPVDPSLDAYELVQRLIQSLTPYTAQD